MKLKPATTLGIFIKADTKEEEAIKRKQIFEQISAFYDSPSLKTTPFINGMRIVVGQRKNECCVVEVLFFLKLQLNKLRGKRYDHIYIDEHLDANTQVQLMTMVQYELDKMEVIKYQ